MAKNKINTTNEPDKKKKKKLFIILGSILGAVAIATAITVPIVLLNRGGGDTPVSKEYTIEWYNDKEETKLLHSETVKAGDTPIYHWDDKPSKEGTDQIKYNWVGWEEAVVPVVGNAKYHAKFDGLNIAVTMTVQVDTAEIEGSDTVSFAIEEGKKVIAVDWGDESDIDANTSHTYEKNGTYTINIWGTFTSFSASNAADYNENVTSVTLSNQITSIGDYAFCSCYYLSSINIPNSVTSIGTYAFGHCYSLTSVTIPESVTSIGDYAFAYCYDLSINCEAESKPPKWDDNWNVVDVDDLTVAPVVWGYVRSGENDDYKYVVHKFGDDNQITITKYKHIDEGTEATIPSTIPDEGVEITVTAIGSYAFYECSSLTSVTIPNSVTSIESYAFYECSSLTSINIPNSVTSIKNYAFWYCDQLDSITIPNSVTSMGAGAFTYCYALSINCEAESKPPKWDENWNVVDVDNLTVAPVVWGYVKSGKNENYKYVVQKIGVNTQITITEYIGTDTEVTIPDTIKDSGNDIPVTAIGGYAFSECSSLTSVTIPNGVTSIGSYAFYLCYSLTSVTIPNSVTSIGDYAFGFCNQLNSITIPNSITSIGGHAFYYCALTSITIPNSVTSIGKSAFSGCGSLTSITVDDGNTVYDSRGNCNAIIEISSNKLVAGCISTAIPNSVTSIGDGAFQGCSLASVTIPNSVTSIESYAFNECSSLTSINIPNSVISIGAFAFARDSSLECVDLSAVDYVITGGYGMLLDCDSLEQIIVKDNELAEKYKAAPYWDEYADYIQVAPQP